MTPPPSEDVIRGSSSFRVDAVGGCPRTTTPSHNTETRHGIGGSRNGAYVVKVTRETDRTISRPAAAAAAAAEPYYSRHHFG